MTFKEIYNRIIPYWGDKVDFSDALISKTDNTIDTPGTTPTGDNYFHSTLLSRQWDAIEETVGHDDTYGNLMVWTLYQVFHKHASQLFGQNIHSFNPKDIDKKEIEEQYFKNLAEDTWEDELSKYQRVIE